jgi:hypothetical protein
MKRRWRVILLRFKGELLGEVEAPDAKAAVRPRRRQLWRSAIAPSLPR